MSRAHTLENLDVCALTAAKGVASGSVLSIAKVEAGDERRGTGEGSTLCEYGRLESIW